jgi:hypothetical protein
MQGTRFRHAAKFLRWRPDKRPQDCRYDQLEVTPAYELDRVFGARRRFAGRALSLLIEEARFALDSPLVGDGFELSFPRDRGWSRSGSRPNSFSKKTDGPNVSRFAQDSRPKDFIPHPAEAMAKRDRRGA